MCPKPKIKVPKQNTPEPVTPAPPPPAPEPSAPPPTPAQAAGVAEGNPYAEQGEYARKNAKKKKGRSGLRIDLSSGASTAGGTGLNVPQG